MRRDLFSIGETARRSGLTVKALRYYDRVGLLRPASTDEATGFRNYSREQVVTASLIGKLRSVDLSLEDIRLCIEAGDQQAEIRRVLWAHETRLESRVTRLNGSLHVLRHFLKDGLESEMTNDDLTEPALSAEAERKVAIRYFNAVWDLMEKEDRTVEEDDLMLHMAHASRYHWGQVGRPENLARGEWQCSRVYAVLRRPEPCLHHAQRVLDICTEHHIGDWDIAFAYEALARANAIAGDSEAARAMTERALEAAEDIKEDEERKIVMADLESIPGQERFW
jgi:DNA-binding transcriptional MerR regulator